MILEFIGAQLADFAAGKLFDTVFDTLQPILTSDRALVFAREELREKYETALLPASYEHVVANLLLTREDFHSYFLLPQRQGTLAEHLRDRLQRRSESWVYNRPNDEIFNRLTDDFLATYQRYFLTNDALLTALAAADTSKEILSVVTDIRGYLTAEKQRQKTSDPSAGMSLGAQVRSFLSVVGVPFEIVSEHPRAIDIVIIDPSSVFANKFLLCVRDRKTSVDEIDELVGLTATRQHLSRILLVLTSAPDDETARYAERRRITINTFEEFKESFYRLAPLERFVVGSLASGMLADSMNIRDIFVPPDAVPVAVGDRMEQRFLDIRRSAMELVADFIADESASVMCVLGGYGSGKSALCAHLMQTLQDTDVVPVYFSLRQLKNSDDIARFVGKADQLARTIRSDGKPLIILDGLDELPNAMNGIEKKQNMLRILEASRRTAKILITARTSYFRGLEDFWSLFRRAEDKSLWNEMARFIPEGGKRPGVRAMILREFDTDQIKTYVTRFAEANFLDAAFADEFLNQMTAHDYGFNYFLLARSPLYIFLIVNSKPWLSPDVHCIADIFDLFVKYWLERDIEKGRSRWSLTTEDRFDFMLSVAWRMFLERRHALTYEEFDQCVRRFLKLEGKADEHISIALDLQTTGIFTSIGNRIQFFSPGFLDYFVVWSFHHFNPPFNGFPFDENPNRLPTVDQMSMWAGWAETKQKGYSGRAEDYLARVGAPMEPSFVKPISLDPGRIVYHVQGKNWNWPYLNAMSKAERSSDREAFRIIANAVHQRLEIDGKSKIRVQLTNKKGLHARAAARVVSSYERWRFDFIGREEPTIEARNAGDSYMAMPLNSLMGLMMLGAGPDAILVLEYRKCTHGEVVTFLESLECKPGKEPGLWLTSFFESD